MSTGRVAGLDGLRGVAVLLVVGSHAVASAFGETSAVARSLLVPFNGGLGVLVFFVLSGYLITGILARESARTGRISFRAFYVRRTLRILPAFYVFLGVVALVAAAGAIDVSVGESLSAGLFVWNYSPAADGWWLGHTWSLAVEEQFYLLWPLALALLPRRWACRVALGYVIAAPVVRVALFAVPELRPDLWMTFHGRADALLIGCLLALAPSAYPRAWARLRDLAQRRGVAAGAIVVLLGSSALESALGGPWLMPFGYTVSAVAAAALVLVVVARERSSLFTSVATWRPLTLVGLISFSLYLWQQLFLAPDDLALPVVGWVPLGLLATFAAATLSYLLVERPALRLKDRWQRARDARPAPAPHLPARRAAAPGRPGGDAALAEPTVTS
ncbi:MULTISPECIES: acyltransferase family protein [unclassified Blastococcus]